MTAVFSHRLRFVLAAFALALPIVTGCGDRTQPGSAPVDILRTFGGPGTDVGNAVRVLANGGYAVIGYTDGPGGDQRDIWLLRLDAQLDTLWTRTYGGPGQDHGWDLAPASDGGFWVAGFSESARGDEDVWVARVDMHGNAAWERTYGGSARERAWALVPLDSGDVLVLAEADSRVSGSTEILVLRIDPHGDTVWTRHTGGPGSNRAFAMTRTGDGAIFAGTSSTDGQPLRMLVGWVSSGAEVQLQTLTGGGGDEIGHGVTSVPDGGFLVTGYGRKGPALTNDVMRVWLRRGGQEIAREVIDGPGDERAMMSSISGDGTLVTIGYSNEGSDWDVTLHYRPADGGSGTTWSDRRFGDARGIMVAPAPDGGWILTGTMSEIDDPGQLLLMKIREGLHQTRAAGLPATRR